MLYINSGTLEDVEGFESVFWLLFLSPSSAAWPRLPCGSKRQSTWLSCVLIFGVPRSFPVQARLSEENPSALTLATDTHHVPAHPQRLPQTRDGNHPHTHTHRAVDLHTLAGIRTVSQFRVTRIMCNVCNVFIVVFLQWCFFLLPDVAGGNGISPAAHYSKYQ